VFEQAGAEKIADAGAAAGDAGARGFAVPAGSVMCEKCITKALVLMREKGSDALFRDG
jgi:hypothetical protein